MTTTQQITLLRHALRDCVNYLDTLPARCEITWQTAMAALESTEPVTVAVTESVPADAIRVDASCAMRVLRTREEFLCWLGAELGKRYGANHVRSLGVAQRKAFADLWPLMLQWHSTPIRWEAVAPSYAFESTEAERAAFRAQQQAEQ